STAPTSFVFACARSRCAWMTRKLVDMPTSKRLRSASSRCSASSRAARELAEQRLDAERKRFEVGMSTSFLVIQAQRDLAQAKTNEVGAVLSYDLSLVDYEMLQEAG